MGGEVVKGMDLTTIQWESEPGVVKNFRVMAILAPQITDVEGIGRIIVWYDMKRERVWAHKYERRT